MSQPRNCCFAASGHHGRGASRDERARTGTASEDRKPARVIILGATASAISSVLRFSGSLFGYFAWSQPSIGSPRQRFANPLCFASDSPHSKQMNQALRDSESRMNLHPLYKDQIYKDQNATQASLSLISKANQRAQINSGEQPGKQVSDHEKSSNGQSSLKTQEMVSAEGIEPSTY